MRRNLFFLALLVLARGVLAQPQFTDVFVSGQAGYHTYRIPAIILTTNGTMLAFCEGRKNSRRDTGKIDLLFKRSTDGGKTWGAQQIIWSDDENVCGNPAPVLDRTTGIIWLLMTWNRGDDSEEQIAHGTSKETRRVLVTHSADDGTTWAKPLEITTAVKKPAWRWYATGPVNGIQLTRLARYKGRLMIPCNHTELNERGESVSRSHVIFSDDHGAFPDGQYAFVPQTESPRCGDESRRWGDVVTDETGPNLDRAGLSGFDASVHLAQHWQ